MKNFRFSLWTMLAAVAAIAAVCAALARPTMLSAWGVEALSFGMLVLAVLASLVYQRGSARAFWIGFAVVGWGKLGLEKLHMQYFTDWTIQVSYLLMDFVHPAQPLVPGPFAPSPANQSVRNFFYHSAFWLWPLILGIIGGVVAMQLYLRDERRTARG